MRLHLTLPEKVILNVCAFERNAMNGMKLRHIALQREVICRSLIYTHENGCKLHWNLTVSAILAGFDCLQYAHEICCE